MPNFFKIIFMMGIIRFSLKGPIILAVEQKCCLIFSGDKLLVLIAPIAPIALIA